MALDFIDLRRKMVDNQIRTVDVTRLSVLEAFLTVPREAFVDEDKQALAYLDEDIMIAKPDDNGPARYIMEPAPLAKLLQLADIREQDRVLDIGATTGYCAALLSNLANKVVAVESNKMLADRAVSTLKQLSCDNVIIFNGPLEKGHLFEGPYHVIVIEGAVDFVPQTIFQQLREGGRLVVVEGHGNAGAAKLYTRQDGVISGRRAFNLAVKPLAGFLKAPEFVFN